MSTSNNRGTKTGKATTDYCRIDSARLRGALSLIKPGTEVDHSGSSLWEHLLNTFEILKSWGAEADVCFAGLIHSIYTTQYFRTAIVAPTSRKQVEKIVGARAERLAYFFCIVDRRTIWEAEMPSLRGVGMTRLREYGSHRTLRVSGATLRGLRLIDLANETEQRQRRQGPPVIWFSYISAAFRSISFIPSHLTADMLVIDDYRERRLLRYYQKAIASTSERSVKLLLRCIAEVPPCAEPRLMLAVAQLENGDVTSAYLNARTALNDLRGWGVAWDTRVPRLAWDLMGSQLMQAALINAREPPPIAEQIATRLRCTTNSISS